MANFSSFFPAAGGGGGFTKMNKYSTFRALDDATHKLLPNIGLRAAVNNLQASLTTSVYYEDDLGVDFTAEDAFVGYTYIASNVTYTITASGANTGENNNFTITMSNNGGYSTIAFNWWAADPAKTMLAGPKTVNPATDLGLSDGDSLGFFMVGAGGTTSSGPQGADGGKIIQGTRIISNASTDLVITPGVGAGTASTISGGLTITTADGSNRSGVRNYNSGGYATTRGNGINGYGQGAPGTSYGSITVQNSPQHGFGSATASSTSSDGAILLFY